MKFNWLESKTMSALFSGSAWAVVCLLMFTILAVTPPFQQIEKTAVGNHTMLVSFFAIVALGVPAILIIMVGMAIFCVFLDHSSVGTKILWFLSFFFTGPLGSLVYFFSVYRKHVAHVQGSASLISAEE
jgi:hypothetical protein